MPAALLVVEDNPMNMELVTDLLSAQGYQVTGAENAQRCLERLRERNYDLILMDLQLPDLDGYSLVRQIRENEEYRKIPIVALTAYAMAGDHEKALKAGCAGVITKPIDTLGLAGQIEQYLQGSRE